MRTEISCRTKGMWYILCTIVSIVTFLKSVNGQLTYILLFLLFSLLATNHRVKADLILIFSTNTNREIVAYRSFQFLEFEVRGVRKVTTGITGLWQVSS